MDAINFLSRIPRRLAVMLISLYQLTLSPDHSWLKPRFPYGYCRHYPTCSEYSKQAINKFGFFKGLALSFKRVASCHPWAEPKIDLIPHS